MDHLKFWFGLWKEEQIVSLKRVDQNTRLALLLLPMGIVEAIINTILIILLTPFIFSRVLDTFIIRTISFYRIANHNELSKIAADKLPLRLSKAEKISRELSKKERELTKDFISKISPFIIGILTILVTLFLTKKI